MIVLREFGTFMSTGFSITCRISCVINLLKKYLHYNKFFQKQLLAFPRIIPALTHIM